MTGTLLGISRSQTFFFFSILPLLDTDSEDRQESERGEETQQGATAAAFCPHGTWPVTWSPSKLNRWPTYSPIFDTNCICGQNGHGCHGNCGILMVSLNCSFSKVE